MTYAVSFAALAVILLIGVTTSINIGIVAFAAAFIIGGWFSQLSADEIVASFPGSIVTILIGITLLFGIARCNGTVDLLVHSALRLVRGNRWAVLWLMFFLACALMTFGAVLAVAIIVPIAMPIARRYRIDPLLMGMMICHGALGAAFSPITVYGAFANGWLASAGKPTDPLLLYLVPLGLNFLLAVLLFAVRGRHLVGSRHHEPEVQASIDRMARPADQDATPEGCNGAVRMTPLHAVTIAGIVALLVGSAVFHVDVGACSMVIAAALLLIAPTKHAGAVNNISWSVVLTVSGMLIYMSVLEDNGTIGFLGDQASASIAPALTLLIVCFAVAGLSSVTSSLGTLGIALPLAGPMLANYPHSVVAVVGAVCFSAVAADVSPFTSNGAMMLASAQVPSQRELQRAMLAYTGYLIVAAPALAWLLIVLPVT